MRSGYVEENYWVLSGKMSGKLCQKMKIHVIRNAEKSRVWHFLTWIDR